MNSNAISIIYIFLLGIDKQQATHIKTTEKSEADLNFTLKQIEGLKIGSLMLLAVICRLILNCGFGLFYFQVIIM
jgi:hypothetical protein